MVHWVYTTFLTVHSPVLGHEWSRLHLSCHTRPGERFQSGFIGRLFSVRRRRRTLRWEGAFIGGAGLAPKQHWGARWAVKSYTACFSSSGANRRFRSSLHCALLILRILQSAGVMSCRVVWRERLCGSGKVGSAERPPRPRGLCCLLLQSSLQ
ncbi:hypothetical protein F4677DRAFT_379056 [Hypoxylon crocopeplum]|nr:hypothetical protein F4677DRAFT_379056 [Hypoxylon crocopeplum]